MYIRRKKKELREWLEQIILSIHLVFKCIDLFYFL